MATSGGLCGWISGLLGGDPPAAAKGERPFRRTFGQTPDERQGWYALAARVEHDALIVMGACPRCGDDIDDFVSLSPEWVDALRDPAHVTTVVRCNCADAHAGRPADATGCGAVAVLDVELTPYVQPARDGSAATRRLQAQVHDARPATERDSTWDEEAAKWDQAATTQLSETAEKWGATVAAIFGLFGLGLILESDRVEDVTASTAEWPWWVLTGLLLGYAFTFITYWDLRREELEPRDKSLFVAGLTTLMLCLAAFVFGQISDPPDGGVTFGMIAGAAVLLALAATSFAGVAAQGSPRWVAYITGNRMREARIRRADRSVRDLRRARITTWLAVVTLGAALAVLWYAPAATPAKQQLKVAKQNGSEVCGDAVAQANPGVTVDPPGERPPETIAFDDVKTMVPVDACEKPSTRARGG